MITLLYCLLLSGMGILIAYLCLPDWVWPQADRHVCEGGGFARRWDGSCHGWTRELALTHIVGDLMHWIAYCSVSYVIARWHPVSRQKVTSRITITLVAVFVFGCGLAHLVEAYTVFNPIYELQSKIKIANGIISLIDLPLILYGLLFTLIKSAKYDEYLRKKGLL